MQKALYERFGDVGLGSPDPEPKPLITYGMPLLPAVFGCEVVFEDGAEDLWQQLIDKLEPPGIEVRYEAADQLLAALSDSAREPSGLTRGRP